MKPYHHAALALLLFSACLPALPGLYAAVASGLVVGAAVGTAVLLARR